MNGPGKFALNIQSFRARKARLGLQLERKPMRLGLYAAVTLLLVFGIFLVSLHIRGGLLLASLAAWPLMLLVWYRYELFNVPPPARPATLDDVLASDVLARLPDHPSPQQIAEVVMSVQGGHFFVARFGIGANFLTELSSKLPENSQAIWELAYTLKDKFNSSVINSPILLAALIEQIPGKEQLLAQLQLDLGDMTKGVAWYEHLHDIIKNHSAQRLSGGIGRDWSFGYTPLLDRFALNVTSSVLSTGLLRRDVEGHQEVLRQMVNLLGGGGRQNVALVGGTGTGKTTLVYALAESLMIAGQPGIPKSLAYRQVIALDPASLIANARGKGDLEGLVNQLFVEAAKAKNVILFLDEAQLFLEDGTGSVDLSNLLLPVAEGGAIRLILAMDEQCWLRLAQTRPAVAQNLNRVNVLPLGREETMLVLEDQLLTMEYRYKVTYMYQALNEAYRLGDRYVREQAMPGKAIAVLEAAAQFAENGLVTARSVQQAVEKNYGIKVTNAQGAEERNALLNLEELIHQRMINQTRAVGVVANALRRARAGVRNQDRPIGTFLFLGPTGVGKTEMAKSLAAVYFGGEDHLVRLDLNEFGQAADVDRLLADGAKDPNSLTAQIAKQPFSVVLLDEIEKAHPNVLNTLLQLLDEGMLRDINNRSVSFRDAIIIATSNAGADRIRQYITAGYQLEQFEEQFVNELIDSGQFKPEFLNRFDEIVLFRPLNQGELVQVVDLMMGGINKALAYQRISVHLAEDAKQQLVKTGYDPRLGARPMRRVIQRTVEDLVAKRMLSGQVTPGSVIDVSLADVQTVLQK
jgi:ATP-dependent Clp protease ATP-binding subunit ClpC